MSQWVREWVSDKHSQWSDSGPIKISSMLMILFSHCNVSVCCAFFSTWNMYLNSNPKSTLLLRRTKNIWRQGHSCWESGDTGSQHTSRNKEDTHQVALAVQWQLPTQSHNQHDNRLVRENRIHCWLLSTFADLDITFDIYFQDKPKLLVQSHPPQLRFKYEFHSSIVNLCRNLWTHPPKKTFVTKLHNLLLNYTF